MRSCRLTALELRAAPELSNALPSTNTRTHARARRRNGGKAAKTFLRRAADGDGAAARARGNGRKELASERQCRLPKTIARLTWLTLPSNGFQSINQLATKRTYLTELHRRFPRQFFLVCSFIRCCALKQPLPVLNSYFKVDFFFIVLPPPLLLLAVLFGCSAHEMRGTNRKK